MKISKKSITTYEIVALAIYLLGGQSEWVDTEDVAVKADELVPRKFRWRKYEDQIDLNSIMISLRHAKRESNGRLVTGSVERGWRLTEAGINSAKKALKIIPNVDSPQPKLDRKEEAWRKRELQRLMQDRAVLKGIAGDLSAVTRLEAERVFRVDRYIVGERRIAQVERIVAAFSNDPTIGAVVRELKQLVEDER